MGEVRKPQDPVDHRHPQRTERELLPLGYGITNFVRRTTATAAELSDAEYVAGAKRLREKVLKYKPRVLAVVGIGAYRTGFGRKTARLGLQDESIGDTRIWILPNPSGLNAHHTQAGLGRLFRELHEALDEL